MSVSPESIDLQSGLTMENEDRQKRALWISLLTAAISILIGIGVVLVLIISPTTIGNPRTIIAVGVLAISSIISAFYSKIGKYQFGIGVLILSVLAISLIFPFISSELGLQIGLLTIIFVSGIASATLEGKYASWAIAAAIILGLYNVLMDFFGPQLAPPGKPTVITIVTVVAFLVYLFVILRRYRYYSLRTKMILAFILVSLIPLAILAILTGSRLSNILLAEARSELTSSGRQAARTIDDFLAQTLSNVYIEAQLTDFKEFLLLPPEVRDQSDRKRQALATLDLLKRSRSGLIRTYGLLDTNGINVLDTEESKIGLSEADQVYFSYPIASSQNYVSPVFLEDEGPSIYFSSPVWNDQGEILGVLRFQFNAFILQDVLMGAANQFGSKDLYAVIIDKDHFIRLGHSRDSSLLYKSYAVLTPEQVAELQAENRLPAGTADTLGTNQQDLVDWLRNWKEVPFFSPSAYVLGGKPALSTVSEIRRAPWLVLTRQPMDVVLAVVENQTRLSVLLSIVIALMMAGVALYATQAISAPITHLTSVAEKITQGDLSVRAPVETDDEIGALAKTFNLMTNELQDTLQGLERRVADRTRAIELSSDVSRRLSNILDQGQLVSEVVEQLQSAFGYYHVQIYIFDAEGEFLNMAGGTGEVGKALLERRHRLKRGQGLVGQACETETVIVVSDTSKDPQWLPNPLLPETRSEIAVPILLGDVVLGALDVQDDKIGGISKQDVDLLLTIANQVAIALRNARQFTRAQQQAQRQAQINTIIQQIQGTQTIESALQVAVRELGRVLDVPRTRVKIALSNDDNGKES
jgi:putative methionine-R-sulfoxide reductase with GAF domain